MRITVDRFLSDTESTASEVSVDGIKVCFGLEDEYRADKIAGETRISPGVHKVGVHTVGRFNARYSSNQFSDIHKGMLHVTGVPNFKWILIHCGVTDKHTAGCLLVGTDVHTTYNAMRLVDSPSAYRKLYSLVIDAALAGDLTIEYIDNERN
jgi:hypothetical protein